MIKDKSYSNPMVFQPEQSFNGSMKSGKKTPDSKIAETRFAHRGAEKTMTRCIDINDLKLVSQCSALYAGVEVGRSVEEVIKRILAEKRVRRSLLVQLRKNGALLEPREASIVTKSYNSLMPCHAE
jgi:hypothetical protein